MAVRKRRLHCKFQSEVVSREKPFDEIGYVQGLLLLEMIGVVVV